MYMEIIMRMTWNSICLSHLHVAHMIYIFINDHVIVITIFWPKKEMGRDQDGLGRYIYSTCCWIGLVRRFGLNCPCILYHSRFRFSLGKDRVVELFQK